MNQNDVLDKIFKAYDVRGRVGTELTNGVSKDIGLAFGNWLKDAGPVAVGYDMRPDSKELATNLIEGLNLSGRDVIELGMVTSDMAVFAIKHLGAAGAAIVTASHNPSEYNGIKLYDATPKTIGLDQGLDSIRDQVVSGRLEPSSKTKKGSSTKKDIKTAWAEFCLRQIDRTKLKPVKIVIDAGNGMAGSILPTILKQLPFDITELYFEPDGTFPNHQANPQNIETLKDLQAAVKQEGAYLGIAFDGDGDRMAMIDADGRPVTGSEMMSLLADKYRNEPDAKLVYEVRTSQAIVDRLRRRGFEPIRSKAGRSNIGDVMRLNDAAFGGETTGHFFFKDYWFNDSGLISMLIALEQIFTIGNGAKPLAEIIASKHSTSPMIPETNFEIDDKEAALDKLKSYFKNAKIDELDGITFTFPSGAWLNLRASNTEPLLRLNAEAGSEQELQEIVDKVKSLIL